MTETHPATLYTDNNNEFFFLIPNAVDIPVGEVEIYTLTGVPQAVDPSFLFPYQVSRDKAQEWVSGQLMTLATQVGKGLQSMWKAFRDSGRPDQQKPRRPINLEVLADLAGETVEDLKTDPAARVRFWEALFGDAMHIFDAAKSDDADYQAQARGYIQDVTLLLQQYGVPVDNTLEQLFNQLILAYQNAQPRE